MEAIQEKRESWLDRPILSSVTLNWEFVLFGLVVLLTIITRLVDPLENALVEIK